MPVLKQRTVNGQRFELKRYKADMAGRDYAYWVKGPSGTSPTVYTQAEGEDMFLDMVKEAEMNGMAGGMGGVPGVRDVDPEIPDFDGPGGF